MQKAMIFSLVLTVFTCAAANDAILTLNSPSATSPSQIAFESGPYSAAFKVAQDSSFQLQSGSNNVFYYNNSTDILESDYSLELGSNVALASGANNIQFQGFNQWKLWVDDDFEDGESREGWSQAQIATCGYSPNTFLGGHCNFGSQTASKTYSGLPAHTKVKLTFNYHFFDEWTGQTAWAQIGGQYVWTEKYQWCNGILPFYCKQVGVNVCGEDTPDRIARAVQVIVQHSDPTITLSFGSTITGDPCLVSWGIDDVRIYIA
mmetsp:Transcript_67366/g.78156  ORF Transcript_67366/g.78156 Transcript_67366/m.78156 type:complete len:262 (+) Transcript_67366:42-827(+)